MTLSVIENLTEQIRLGCDYEFDDLNNYRMSTCQYLAYIYTFRAISTTTLFNVSLLITVLFQYILFTSCDRRSENGFQILILGFQIWYYLISYGVTYRDDLFTRMDPPDNMYRVRMVGLMLRICGDYLTSSNSKRRLNFFLKYFQVN